MHKVVVSDASCFIALTNIDELQLLEKLYQQVYTTPDVAAEFGDELPKWVEVVAPVDRQKQQLLEFQIDRGEASAIALALEISAELIILDDYKARLAAEKLHLEITGTIGIIIKAKENGVIESIKPALKKLQTTNFRISENLIQEALRVAGE
jgi:predicted nucleic acid-binding protein